MKPRRYETDCQGSTSAVVAKLLPELVRCVLSHPSIPQGEVRSNFHPLPHPLGLRKPSLAIFLSFNSHQNSSRPPPGWSEPRPSFQSPALASNILVV